MKLNDLTGQRFGRLTVLERVENNKWGQRKYLCKCNCGREIVTLGKNLCNGRVKSCGCVRASEKNLQNLEGMQFGDLKVLERAEIGYTLWKCRCICGAECIVASHDLISGKKKSCGCRRGQNHKMSGTPIYNLWQHIKLRCFNPEYAGYENYGGRGITICDEWLNFQAFYDYISKLEQCGEEGYTIDRIDVNGNYEPGNVRFAFRRAQSRNKRNNIYADYFGKRTLLVDIAELTGIKYNTLVQRLKKGLNDVDLIKPVKKVVPKSDLVLVQDNNILTTSLKVAEVFEKRHDHVIRDIEEIIRQITAEPASDIETPKLGTQKNIDLTALNMFQKSSYKVEGQNRSYPMYLMNRDGFSLLVMGFTGQKALEFKLKYIAEFNRMEAALKGKSAQQKSEKAKPAEPKAAPKENLSLVQKIETLKFLVEHSPNDEVKISYLEKIAALI